MLQLGGVGNSGEKLKSRTRNCNFSRQLQWFLFCFLIFYSIRNFLVRWSMCHVITVVNVAAFAAVAAGIDSTRHKRSVFLFFIDEVRSSNPKTVDQSPGFVWLINQVQVQEQTRLSSRPFLWIFPKIENWDSSGIRSSTVKEKLSRESEKRKKEKGNGEAAGED